MRTEQDGRGFGLYSSGEAARAAMAMAAALFASAPSRASMTAARTLARGRVPARRVFRDSRGNEGFRVGAWAGDGSVSVMTRQRRRKAMRIEAKAAGRERIEVIRAELEERAHERHLAEIATVRGAFDAATRSMGKGGSA